MRRIASIIVAAASLVIAAPTVGTAHDNASACSGVVEKVETPAGTFYVDDRRPTHGNFKDVPTSGYWGGFLTGSPVSTPLEHSGNGVWLYMESNGKPGLQRGGANYVLMAVIDDEDNILLTGSEDPCTQTGPWDMIIF